MPNEISTYDSEIVSLLSYKVAAMTPLGCGVPAPTFVAGAAAVR